MARRFLILAAFVFAAFPALAVDWICTIQSAPTRAVIASSEIGEGSTSGAAVGMLNQSRRGRMRTKIERADLIQAYSGQPVLLGHTWLLAVMLPASHPDTRLAFADIGISAEAAERMAGGAGLVDRGIRVVQTPSQMIDKISNNPPAVGYVGFFTGARDVAMCF